MSRSEWQNHIGVGQANYGIGRRTGVTRKLPVIADDGPLAGRTVGVKREHGDGRVDAKATAMTITRNPSISARKATP